MNAAITSRRQPLMDRKLFHTMLNNSIVITAFCVLIVVGLHFSAQGLLDRVGCGYCWESLWYLFAGTMCFTPTNVALLSIVAAYIGAEVNTKTYDITEHWRLATARGLVVFVVMFGASEWFKGGNVLDHTQESYFKLALAVGAAALAAGFEPTRIATMLKSGGKP